MIFFAVSYVGKSDLIAHTPRVEFNVALCKRKVEQNLLLRIPRREGIANNIPLVFHILSPWNNISLSLMASTKLSMKGLTVGS